MNWIIALTLPLYVFANPARKIVVHKDEVVTVKTAIGIASIIQVPDQPTSLVLGDSAAFKVEYLNQAITVKPLRGNATSNLYINTEFDRYSVKLVAGAQGLADYVVYLKPFEKPRSEFQAENLGWKKIGIRRTSRFGSIELSKMATARNTIFFEFEIIRLQDTKIDPGSFWVFQEKVGRPIQDLLLSSLEAKRNEPVKVTLSVRRSDLKVGAPVEVELRLSEKSSFYISKELLWKN